jgi:hypothetical protein
MKLAKERLLMALVMTMKKGRYPAYQFFSSRPFFVIDKADSEIVVGPVEAVALMKYAGRMERVCCKLSYNYAIRTHQSQQWRFTVHLEVIRLAD